MRRLVFVVLAVGVLVLLYAPMVAVGVLSVTSTKLGTASGGVSLEWYRKLAADADVLAAARSTLWLALGSTAIATPLGTMLALGTAGRKSRAVEGLIALPLVTPDIAMAAAMVVGFSLARQVLPVLAPGLLTMVLAHVTFQISFVTLTVRSRLATLPGELSEAAADLYASQWYALRRVYLPLLAPSIVAGGLLAFTLSLDDFVISFFTAGPDSTTLPILIYGSLKRGLSPELLALSTLVTLATVGLVLIAQPLVRREEKSR
jgi:spermidine/putrescine transport system permease protein